MFSMNIHLERLYYTVMALRHEYWLPVLTIIFKHYKIFTVLPIQHMSALKLVKVN